MAKKPRGNQAEEAPGKATKKKGGANVGLVMGGGAKGAKAKGPKAKLKQKGPKKEKGAELSVAELKVALAEVRKDKNIPIAQRKKMKNKLARKILKKSVDPATGEKPKQKKKSPKGPKEESKGGATVEGSAESPEEKKARLREKKLLKKKASRQRKADLLKAAKGVGVVTKTAVTAKPRSESGGNLTRTQKKSLRKKAREREKKEAAKADGTFVAPEAGAEVSRKERRKQERKDRQQEVNKLRAEAAASSGETKKTEKRSIAKDAAIEPEKKKGKKSDPKGREPEKTANTKPESKKKKAAAAADTEVPTTTPLLLTSAVGKAAERLKGSRFRWLNETLYSTTGDEAKAIFDQDPSLAVAYHEGFTAQRAKWPRDPLLDVIAWIKKSVAKDAVVGDFGCGEARIAEHLPDRKVHSFDLAKVNERVTPCNLADVPMPDDSLDVVVFCLALMGTDWLSFIQEAHRCLKPGGLCHIVEVESRFSDMNAVVAGIKKTGFKQVLNKPGNFFVEFRFEKTASGVGSNGGKQKTGNKQKPAAKQMDGLTACTYRKR